MHSATYIEENGDGKLSRRQEKYDNDLIYSFSNEKGKPLNLDYHWENVVIC